MGEDAHGSLSCIRRQPWPHGVAYSLICVVDALGPPVIVLGACDIAVGWPPSALMGATSPYQIPLCLTVPILYRMLQLPSSLQRVA